MSVAFSFNKASDSLTMILCNQTILINSSHKKFNTIKKMLGNGSPESAILKVVQKNRVESKDLEEVSKNRVRLIDGKVCLDGKELHNIIVDRVYDFIQNDLPFEHLLLFIDNIHANPSYRAQQELFTFLEHGSLPITPDGCFYAYKSVRPNWMDHHTGKCDNHIGNELSMDRPLVDDDCSVGCSKGFHCGTLSYAESFNRGNSRLIIVKVNPADVVSVPKDCSCQKVRMCKYKCYAEYKEELTDPLYDDAMNSFTQTGEDISCSWEDIINERTYDGEVYDAEDVIVLREAPLKEEIPNTRAVAAKKKQERDSKGRFI